MTRSEFQANIKGILEKNINITAKELIEYIESVMIPKDTVKLSHLRGLEDNAFEEEKEEENKNG